MRTYPRDRFDSLPEDLDRVGAHRALPRPGRGWRTFGWAALATALLIAGGVVGMFLINDRVAFTNVFNSSASATPTIVPTAQPSVDRTALVVVLNGTTTAGLAGKVGDLLVSQGWTVESRTNASSSTVTATTIYYSDPTQEGAARALAAALNGAAVVRSDQFRVAGQSRLTVVLGSDYVPAP